MAKDPAFLFYPGDYLRDTQNLSEKSQVAYDRIMCEHMRNICEDMNNITVSKKQVDFFIKRLSGDEKEELMFVLIKKGNDFQIEWVAESIAKRKSYSNSRSKNREGKSKKDMKTYVSHMENEIENEIEYKIKNKTDFEIFNLKSLCLYSAEEIGKHLKEDMYVLQVLENDLKLSREEIYKLIDRFLKDQALNLHRSFGEISKHLQNWAKKQEKETSGKLIYPGNINKK